MNEDPKDVRFAELMDAYQKAEADAEAKRPNIPMNATRALAASRIVADSIEQYLAARRKADAALEAVKA